MKKNYKIIALILIFLLFFYFLIFKNILKLMELKDTVEQEEVKISSLEYEAKVISEALEAKRAEILEEQEKIVEKEEKEKFENMDDLFKYLNQKFVENNILFESFARGQRTGEDIKINISFKGKEKGIKNFFEQIEKDKYALSFSKSHFSMSMDKNMIEVKININSKVSDIQKLKEVEENNIKNIFKFSLENLDKENVEVKSKIRIGGKEIFRTKKSEVAK